MSIYKNEVEKPSPPSQGTMERGMGCMEWKPDADPIVYGQASAEGCRSDEGKIMSQMKNYHWD